MNINKLDKRYSISFIGYGNVAYRLAISLQKYGHNIDYICGRDSKKAAKLAYILNKEEHSANEQNTMPSHVLGSVDYSNATTSQIVILAVSDSAICAVADEFYSFCKKMDTFPLVLHCSGATPLEVLNNFPNHGVLYPLMTLSATKPVDFKFIPFFIESSSKEVSALLKNICISFNAEYKEIDSKERAQLHVSAVYVSNFINYLTGLAFDLSKPNHISLMPLAIETIRKAFLFEPHLVQTGPAIRGDIETINKHLTLLEDFPEHKEVYELLTEKIIKRRKEK